MSSESNYSQWTTDPRPGDILFGRGSGPNDHEGNIRFRDIVNARKDEYMNTNHRQTKARIAREVIEEVYAQNGRFLRKADAKDMKRLKIHKGADAYCVVDDDAIMEKAKQALRQNREKAHPARLPGKTAKRSPALDSKPLSTVRAGSMLSDVSLTPLDPATAPVFPGEVAYPQYASARDQEGPWVGSAMMRSGDLDTEYSATPDTIELSNAAVTLGGLSDDSPSPARLIAQHEVNRRRMYDHTSQSHVMDMPPPQGPGPDEQRSSIKVSDLMQHFDEMKTVGERNFHSSNDLSMGTFGESTDTMGTLDPYPLDGRNHGSLSSSTAAYFRTAMEDSAADLSVFRGEASTGSSAGYGSGAQLSGEAVPNQDSWRRGLIANRPKPMTTRKGSSDASLTVDHLTAMWKSDRTQVSQVVEGDAASSTVERSPRRMGTTADDPENLNTTGSSSMDFIKALGVGSSTSTGLGNSGSVSGSGDGSAMSLVKSTGMGSSGTDSGALSGESSQFHIMESSLGA